MSRFKDATAGPNGRPPDWRQSFLVCGAPEPPRAPWRLRAGPVEMHFDPATAFLRRLRIGPIELVRAIYGAVRDRNWGTVQPVISNLKSQISEDAFTLEFEADCRAEAIHFVWRGRITGRPDGTVEYSFDGAARTTFWKNRIGLCVLHPIDECAGRPCTIEHTDGRLTRGQFPRLVAPHQPFGDIRAIAHEAAPGLGVEVRFSGETFEMEDQRNWTDASFKTYGTPLELPFPVEITAGTPVRQSVAVRLMGSPPARRAPGNNAGVERVPVRLTADPSAARPLPPIGLGMAGHGRALTGREIERLRLLRPAHLRVDLRPAEATWPQRLARAVEDAAAVGAALEAALFLSDEAGRELDALLGAAQATSARVARWLVLHAREKSCPRRVLEPALGKLRALDAAVPVATGTDANFAELNRQRPPTGLEALPCFSANPQVHAFDAETLIENLAAQVPAVTSAHAFSGQPVVVSPITLRPRFNAVATAEEAPPAPDELPFAVDPRQASLLGAAWTLGSLAMLAPRPEIHSLTYYESTGWRGVMECESGSPLPEKFPSRPGEVFPLFHVFAALAGFAKVFPLLSSDPLAVQGLGLSAAAGGRRWVIANLTGEPRAVAIESPGRLVRCRVLDETNVEEATRNPFLTIEPDSGELSGANAAAFDRNAAVAPAETSRHQQVGGSLRLDLRRWALAIVDVGL